MSQHRSVPCPATAVAGQLTGIVGVLAAGAVNAHMHGLQAAAYAREERASHILYQQVEEASDVARQWADYAKRLIAENEQLKAENERLRTVSRQRQAMVDHLLNKAKVAA
jgi:hypothetical protein